MAGKSTKKPEEGGSDAELMKVTVQLPAKAHAQMHQLLGLKMEFNDPSSNPSPPVAIGQLYREAVDLYLKKELPRYMKMAAERS